MNNNAIALWGFLILSGIGIFFAFTPKFLDPMDRLSNLGTAEATITEAKARVYAKSRESAGTSVNYQFKVGDKTYIGDSTVDEDLSVGQKVTVQYHGKDPAVNGMELRGHALIDLFIFLVPVVAFLVSGTVLYLGYKRK